VRHLREEDFLGFVSTHDCLNWYIVLGIGRGVDICRLISEQLVPKQHHVARLNEIAASGVVDLVSETACAQMNCEPRVIQNPGPNFV
jgi:hypothetical protein